MSERVLHKKIVIFFFTLQQRVAEKTQNLRRLQAQRNELNSKVRVCGSFGCSSFAIIYYSASSLVKFSNSIVKSILPAVALTDFQVRMLKEELQQLHEQGSYVGEVSKAMDKKKVLVKVCFFRIFITKYSLFQGLSDL